MTRVCIGFYLVLFIFITSTAWAITYGGPQVTYYDVSGAAPDIRRQMQAKGREGRAAYTDYNIISNFRTAPGAGGCSISSVTITLKVNILMPRLAAGDANVRQRWARFEPALRRHEMGHAALALAAAQETELALLDMPAQPDCERAAALANKTAYEILRDLTQQNEAYDQKTKHGVTQGAVFP